MDGCLHACLYAVRSIGENCLRQVTVHGELSNPRHSAAVTWILVPRMQLREQSTEPVFLNVYETRESIPRKEFRQPEAWRAGTITPFLLGA